MARIAAQLPNAIRLNAIVVQDASAEGPAIDVLVIAARPQLVCAVNAITRAEAISTQLH